MNILLPLLFMIILIAPSSFSSSQSEMMMAGMIRPPWNSSNVDPAKKASKLIILAGVQARATLIDSGSTTSSMFLSPPLLLLLSSPSWLRDTLQFRVPSWLRALSRLGALLWLPSWLRMPSWFRASGLKAPSLSADLEGASGFSGFDRCTVLLDISPDKQVLSRVVWVRQICLAWRWDCGEVFAALNFWSLDPDSQHLRHVCGRQAALNQPTTLSQCTHC
jgi:hypothetical protein